jgi:hypothetical protein
MKAPKWESRGRLGIYLGTSEYYAKTVGLVLSSSTGLVSPQFHLKFDDKFLSVSPKVNNNIPASEWQFKCGFLLSKTKTKYIDISNVPTIKQGILEHTVPQESIHLPIQATTPDNEGEIENAIKPIVPTPVVELVRPIDAPISTCSGRISGPPAHLEDYIVYEALSMQLDQLSPPSDYLHPLTYDASSDPDVLYYQKAMVAHDKENFITAMEQEISGQAKNGNWEIVDH